MKKKGYVIANENEEFLAECKENDLGRLIKWALTPELALVFQDKKYAEKTINQIQDKKLWVLTLFENKKQLAVGTEEEDKPHWLI